MANRAFGWNLKNHRSQMKQNQVVHVIKVGRKGNANPVFRYSEESN